MTASILDRYTLSSHSLAVSFRCVVCTVSSSPTTAHDSNDCASSIGSETVNVMILVLVEVDEECLLLAAVRQIAFYK